MVGGVGVPPTNLPPVAAPASKLAMAKISVSKNFFMGIIISFFVVAFKLIESIIHRVRKILYIALLLPLSACITRKVDLGVPMRESQIETVKAAKTKAEVAGALGSPAATTLDGDKWFYFRAGGTRFAFLHPRFNKYQILEVEFEGETKVKEVALRDVKDNNFSTDSRKTKYTDESTNFFRELFGNVGQFNMAGLGTASTTE